MFNVTVIDGPHWAVGYSVDAPIRTSADGEVWAFTDQNMARRSMIESISEPTVDLESLEGFGVRFHDRPTAECRECQLMTAPGEYAEVWTAHWSTLDSDGDRTNRGDTLSLGDMHQRGTEWHPTPDTCSCMFD